MELVAQCIAVSPFYYDWVVRNYHNFYYTGVECAKIDSVRNNPPTPVLQISLRNACSSRLFTRSLHTFSTPTSVCHPLKIPMQCGTSMLLVIVNQQHLENKSHLKLVLLHAVGKNLALQQLIFVRGEHTMKGLFAFCSKLSDFCHHI